MRIGFNGRLLSDATLRGWNRYTINLLRELAAYDVHLFLYTDRPLHPNHLSVLQPGSYTVRESGPMRFIRWLEFWLPQQCRIDQLDVLHSPFNYGLPFSSPCRRVLTLHDAVDQIYYGRDVPFLARLRPAALRMTYLNWTARVRSHRVITVSHHAKADLVAAFGLPPGKITVTYEGADEKFHQPLSEDRVGTVARKHGIESPYVFYVGGWEKRKNMPFLLKAFAAAQLPQVKLALAGGKAAERHEIIALARSFGIADRVQLLEFIPDEDLPFLYRGALCFVYPSEYEGFGLQLCEAMAVGCPVLAAQASCLPEILGNGGETFPLDDVGPLAELLKRLFHDASFRATLADRAAIRGAEFSWSKMAAETMSVYRNL
jgi:glycosyltransferase involved in cell wall biosynthesis